MYQLPSVEELYPYGCFVKHRGSPLPVSLACVKWLEAQGILVNRDFYMDVIGDEDRVEFRFRKKAALKKFKAAKKEIRNNALQAHT
jgi:hypothetical protein